MSYEINEIKTIRKKLGLTQSELAKQSNVSQSLITKIESGTLDPTYSKVKQIFEVLNSLSSSKEKKAKDIMNKKLIGIGPETPIKDIIKEMRKHSISQMPVIKGDHCIGLISETILLDAFGKKDITKAEDIMGDIPPIIAKDTSIDLISQLLRVFPIVMVSEKGRLLGVITKADILKSI
jgi:predicted transcriptional regulator